MNEQLLIVTKIQIKACILTFSELKIINLALQDLVTSIYVTSRYWGIDIDI